MIIGMVALFSCKKDETKATIKATPDSPTLNLEPGQVIVLQEADKDVPITYSWTAVDFGVELVIAYEVQVALQGNDFADPVSLGIVTNDLSLTLTTEALNSKLQTLELDPSLPQPMSLDFRVKATISSDVDPAYSGLVNQTITAYYVEIIYPVLFVPGSYQGWNPADSTTSIGSVGQNTSYDGYLWFDADAVEFKYTQGPSWDLNWGDDAADGTLEPNGANIISGAAGYYHLTVDLAAMTHTFLRTEWGLIGDATPGGWDTDTDMTWDPVNKVWTVTVELTAANIKFRANHAWDLNYGDTGANGVLEKDGDNIAVPSAGNYTVTLNLSKPVYRYTLVKN
jgi:starch-binding outer membrane protein SusE/F